MRQGIVAFGAMAGVVASFLFACRSNPPTPSARQLASTFGLEPRPAASDGVPIKVVDARSGKPVADALVVSVDEWWFTYSDNGEYGAPPESAALLRKHGEAYVTASDGTTRVARPDEPRCVFAWRGDEFGRVTLEVQDRAEHVIAIGPRDLLVEVVDRAGRPQPGVPIHLAKCALEPDSLSFDRAITGADGRCSIPALELARGVHRTCGYRNLVQFGCLVDGDVCRPLDAPSVESVQLVLPDCGEVVVELRDGQGRPLPDEIRGAERLRLAVGYEKPGEPSGLTRSRTSGWPRILEFPYRNEPIRLGPVEIGMGLTFTLQVYSAPRRLSYCDFDVEGDAAEEASIVPGPTKVGEVKHVTLRIDTSEWDDEAEPELDENDERPEISAEARQKARAAARAANGVTEPEEPDVTPYSSIELAVITDVPIAPCTLRARVDDNTNPIEHNTCPWIDVTGRATMRAIGADTHSISIVVSGFDRTRREIPLWRIEEVEVPPGVHHRDARLLSIDLRGKIRRTSIDVVDEAGQPLSGRLVLLRDDGDSSPETIYFKPGHHDLVTATSDPCRVVVAVDRFRPAEIDVSRARQRIVMKRGFPIRLVLDPLAPQLGDRVSKLYVGVSERPRCGLPPDEAAEDETVRTVEIGPGGTASFEVPEPGDWRVVFLHTHRGADGDEEECNLETPEECDLETPMEATIHVEERAQEQRFTVAPLRWMEPVQERDADEEQDSPSSPDDG